MGTSIEFSGGVQDIESMSKRYATSHRRYMAELKTNNLERIQKARLDMISAFKELQHLAEQAKHRLISARQPAAFEIARSSGFMAASLPQFSV
ncbi:MAG: hypothetical protein MUF67_10845 [Desulfobacterales bacterium]|jgi:hypothetical protein|nr:hypothetical protein [Desulfobacterales bacterium]MDZ7596736.1 hypothetical protein [Desulfobacterales bacterium]